METHGVRCGESGALEWLAAPRDGRARTGPLPGRIGPGWGSERSCCRRGRGRQSAACRRRRQRMFHFLLLAGCGAWAGAAARAEAARAGPVATVFRKSRRCKGPPWVLLPASQDRWRGRSCGYRFRSYRRGEAVRVSTPGVSTFFGRRDCEMTRRRPRGLVFKVRRVFGGFGRDSVSCFVSMT